MGEKCGCVDGTYMLNPLASHTGPSCPSPADFTSSWKPRSSRCSCIVFFVKECSSSLSARLWDCFFPPHCLGGSWHHLLCEVFPSPLNNSRNFFSLFSCSTLSYTDPYCSLGLRFPLYNVCLHVFLLAILAVIALARCWVNSSQVNEWIDRL